MILDAQNLHPMPSNSRCATLQVLFLGAIVSSHAEHVKLVLCSFAQSFSVRHTVSSAVLSFFGYVAPLCSFL